MSNFCAAQNVIKFNEILAKLMNSIRHFKRKSGGDLMMQFAKSIPLKIPASLSPLKILPKSASGKCLSVCSIFTSKFTPEVHSIRAELFLNSSSNILSARAAINSDRK